MKIEVNKKTICFTCVVILLLSALIYNILYINNKKNEIIEEIETEEILEETVEEIKTIFVDIGGEVIDNQIEYVFAPHSVTVMKFK